MLCRLAAATCLVLASTLPATAATRPTNGDFLPYETFEGVVTHVVEGDVLVIKPLGDRASAGEQEAWLIGSDTPEPGQGAWTERARAHVRELVEGKRVRFALDAAPRARCGRLRVYVYEPNGELLNLALVRDGWAEVMSKAPDLAHDAELRAALVAAKAAGRGIWSSQNGLAVLPSAYRHAHPQHDEPAPRTCDPARHQGEGTSFQR